jgi:organic hydroperoxide reductase OsmC/OhrA
MAQEATSKHQARVKWDADQNDLRAHMIELADQRLAASGAEALGGDPAKADPEELFVASLSSCHMLWFISLARAERLRVTAYEDEAVGTLDATRFTGVVLRPRVSFANDPGAERVLDLHHRAHEHCYIANSVNCPVTVEPRS